MTNERQLREAHRLGFKEGKRKAKKEVFDEIDKIIKRNTDEDYTNWKSVGIEVAQFFNYTNNNKNEGDKYD